MAQEPKILLNTARDVRPRSLPPDVDKAWRWIGWFALILAVAGIADWILAWVPIHLGRPEWEFGTIVASVSGLPLVTMGFAGLLGSALARGIRWQLVVVGSIVLFFGLVILVGLTVFLLDVPIALNTVEGPARLGIIKATIKTSLLAAMFSVAYLGVAIAAIRHAIKRDVQ